MTQNPWAQATPQASTDQYTGDGVVPPQDGVAPPQVGVVPAHGTERAVSKQETAREEAADVKRHATDAAQNVAETAKTEAVHVAAEVKTNARDLLHQAKSDLTEQAGTQQQKVAEGLRAVAGELHSMAAASEQPGVATDVVRQAAERSAAVASWLDDRDPGSLLTEVKTFARQRPGTFLLLAAGAGVLAGRLSRSLSAGAPETTGTTATGTSAAGRIPDTGVAVPPPPVQMPAPQTTTAGFADTYPPNPLDSELGTADPLHDAGPGRRATEPMVGEPLRSADPFRDDPFDGGRR
ncbi:MULTISPECIES: hypothetical protein [unclassified Arthrobacter]|uniref:hypothetical protein n=1 Tax=unclassified Arthrobacter TaxID=235627 RepID=UPI001DFDF89A|nr:hypothetical protein [Arthrobacter sp. Bi26]CAH0134828.1 hypothetical protein SRABI26_00320 [Arthrobacter sp. Bi26]